MPTNHLMKLLIKQPMYLYQDRFKLKTYYL
jgi:hypothetical protein